MTAITCGLFFLQLLGLTDHADAAGLSILRAAEAPEGFSSVCSSYRWACASRAGRVDEASKYELAKKVNAGVNKQVQPVSDRVLYGRDEHWILPTAGKGDCEDYALMKMKLLLDAGVASKDLLLATVLTGRGEHHVVLVVRTTVGDYFLDNLTGAMRLWNQSGYTVVKMQRPNSRSNWGLVLQGPMVRS